MTDEELEGPPPSVAIIGMSGRFPGAPDLDTYWHNLVEGVESVRFFTREEQQAEGLPTSLLDDPAFVPARAPIDDADCFDAAFFGMSPREAQITDPQHRLFLEVCWSALEDAGCDPARTQDAIGVFGGCSANTYLINNVLGNPELLESLGGMQAVMSSDNDHLCTRVSYKLDLRGPSMTIQTACSTSLVAVQQAYHALLSGQCDVALAGGASVAVPIRGGHRHRQGDIYSADGHNRSFDAQATGTVSGDGVGVVVLKRLEDAIEDGDRIRAVLLGAAINNDGALKVGYSAPSVEGQTEVIAQALSLADVDPASIGYVEAHATATTLGDPIEVSALIKAFRAETDEVGFCSIGSVKSNIGHLNAAAGVAGLIKTVLALEHGVVPPSLNYSEPNPAIDFDSSPFRVSTEVHPWPDRDGPRRAGVSSFGAGGTNAHVVVEQAPEAPARSADPGGISRILPLSARSPVALDAMTAALAAHLEAHPETDLRDVDATLKARRAFPYRRAVVAETTAEALAALREPERPIDGLAPEARASVVFAFPAQGCQHVNMGRELYEADAAFRADVDRCAELIEPLLGSDIRKVLYPTKRGAKKAARRIDDQLYAGAALFCVSYGLARWWIARGVEPEAVLGHSTGEYIAAAIAGVLSLEESIALFMARARLMATLPDGGVLHVPLPHDEVADVLLPGTYVALYNSPTSTVVTGESDAIDRLEAQLEETGLPGRRIRVSVPAHSPLLEPIADEFRAAARRVSPRAPEVPMLSGVTGSWLSDEEITDPDYWVRHLLEPVRFDQVMQRLGELDACVVVEVGPGRCVSPLVGLNVPELGVVASLPAESDETPLGAPAFQRRALAGLWTCGVDLPDARFEPDPDGRHISLPTYPFERQRHWIDSGTLALVGGATLDQATAKAPRSGRAPRPAMSVAYRAPTTRAERELCALVSEVLGIEPVGVDDHFFTLGGDSLIMLKLIDLTRQRLGCVLPAAAAFGGLTVASMAPHLDLPEQAAPRPNGSPVPGGLPLLVPLEPEGRKRPVYFVHPAAGVIFPYFELARALGGERPVYALQARGLDGETEPDKTTEEMAERYVAEVKRVQPEGPYHLAGYSYGSYIIFDMARQLLALGEEVATLSIIDEVAPIDGNRPRLSHLVRLTMGRAGRTFWHHFHDYSYLRSETRRARRNGSDEGMRAWLRFVGGGGMRNVLQRSAMAALVPPESQVLAFDQPTMLPMAELLMLHVKATWDYSPEPQPIRATLFKSDWWYQRPFFDRGHTEETLGWKHLCLGGVDVRRGSGDHLAIMRQPHVQVLARQLRDVLDEADARW